MVRSWPANGGVIWSQESTLNSLITAWDGTFDRHADAISFPSGDTSKVVISKPWPYSFSISGHSVCRWRMSSRGGVSNCSSSLADKLAVWAPLSAVSSSEVGSSFFVSVSALLDRPSTGSDALGGMASTSSEVMPQSL
ncbi:hypothetical protein OGATHE_001339 [Ogataea polymorpha]|uniref:Uncharacterized protein n=1 Tax=Ogataea polymorpha TaxID=460523 RepID=A0A9P8TFG5_9ASCO|nr:hypothetical protein OGATHE_001339 [Ogataea polymorpha]